MSPPCELWLAVLHTAAPESARAPPGIVTIATAMARASTAADSAFLMFIPIVTIDLPVVRFDGSRAISRRRETSCFASPPHDGFAFCALCFGASIGAALGRPELRLN